MQKLKIFISSTFRDLKEERQIAELEINKMNRTLVNQDIFLELILWEETEVKFGSDIKDSLSNLVKECDIFILILSTRYSNYTREEFRHAIERQGNKNKPQIMVMIKDAPIELSGIDIDALKKLSEFKKEIINQRLVSYFDNLDSFRIYLRRGILDIINDQQNAGKGKKTDLSHIRVFISYNHKDSLAAHNIKSHLSELGVRVIIDSESLSSGMDIESFIKESILNSDLTLSIVSRNSLLSSWVSLETIESFNKETSSRIKFLPVVLDNSFFERKFTGDAIEIVDNELHEIVEILKVRFEKKTGFADLYGEFKRYLALRNNIDEIVRRLRESLSVDVSQQKFETGFQKVVDYLMTIRNSNQNNEA